MPAQGPDSFVVGGNSAKTRPAAVTVVLKIRVGCGKIGQCRVSPGGEALIHVGRSGTVRSESHW